MNIERLCLGCMSDIGNEQVCPVCGYDPSVKNPLDTLPLKSILNNRFLVGSFKKQNAEGITYIAWDRKREIAVEVCEYFPKGVSVRNPDTTVSPASNKKFVFNEGLLEFLEINRKLKDAKLAAVAEVYDVFEENGTAYSVFAIISGISFKKFLEQNGKILKWEQVRSLFLPFIDAAQNLNDIGIIHAGISPDSIIVGRDGKLRLTDICINNVRISGHGTESDIAGGFAATEQYGVDGEVIGPYTDVYGLSAVIFTALIGIEPPSCMERLESDTLTIPSRFATELPRQVLVALANGLQINPKNRTATVDGFKNELFYGEVKVPEQLVTPKETKKSNTETVAPKTEKSSTGKYVLISSLVTLLVIGAVAVILSLTLFKDVFFPKDTSSKNESSKPSSFASQPASESEPTSSVTEKKYSVPNVLGRYFSEISGDKNPYESFTFKLIGKDYSDKYTKGQILYQSLGEGETVTEKTEIEIRVSLGSAQTAVPNVIGLDETSAKLELLKKGFSYDNIEVVNKYDSESKSGIVLQQSPEANENADIEGKIKIYINSYTEE